MPTLVAKERFPYGGSYLEAGECFEESEKHAEILIALGKADYMNHDVVSVKPSSPTPDEYFESLVGRARAAGVRVDGRWALPRLLDEVEKAERYRRRDLRGED